MPLASHAETGVVRIFGAITEPVCKVQAAAIDRPDSQKRPTGARTLQLDMNCHTDQSVQLAFKRSDDAGQPYLAADQGARRPNAAGAPLALAEGETIPLALKGRQQSQFNFDLAARSGTEKLALQRHADHVLVSLTYR